MSDRHWMRLRDDLIGWMFVFWLLTVIPLGGLMVALTQATR